MIERNECICFVIRMSEEECWGSLVNDNDASRSIEWWLILILVVVSLVIFGGIAALCFHQRKLRKEVDIVANIGAKEMRKGLIVSVPIGHYERSSFPDLPVDRDCRNMKELAEFLKFDFLTIDGKLKWTEREVMDFMTNSVGKEFFDDEGTAKYDGLIVSLSGHGVRNHIVTSDGKLMDRTAIHRCISEQYPKIRDFPRIFLFDACDGAGDREKTKESVDAKKAKVDSQSIDMEDSAQSEETNKGQEVQRKTKWTTDTKNPDYNLITVHASNAGYVAKMHGSEQVGSYLTYFFVQKLKRDVEDGNTNGLGAMMDNIERLLHDSGKQLIRTEFFSETRKLRIERNVLE